MPLPPSRRWLQFSVRTLLVAMTMFAVVLAYHVKWMRDRREFLSGTGYDLDAIRRRPAPRAPGLLWLLGERGASTIYLGDRSGAEESLAKKLFPEADVRNIHPPNPFLIDL